jgi:hypothetical protein
MAARVTENAHLSSGVASWDYSELLETRWLSRYLLNHGYFN